MTKKYLQLMIVLVTISALFIVPVMADNTGDNEHNKNINIDKSTTNNYIDPIINNDNSVTNNDNSVTNNDIDNSVDNSVTYHGPVTNEDNSVTNNDIDNSVDNSVTYHGQVTNEDNSVTNNDIDNSVTNNDFSINTDLSKTTNNNYDNSVTNNDNSVTNYQKTENIFNIKKIFDTDFLTNNIYNDITNNNQVTNNDNSVTNNDNRITNNDFSINTDLSKTTNYDNRVDNSVTTNNDNRVDNSVTTNNDNRVDNSVTTNNDNRIVTKTTINTDLSQNSYISGSNNKQITINGGDIGTIDAKTYNQQQYITQTTVIAAPEEKPEYHHLNIGVVDSQIVSLYNGEVLIITNDNDKDIMQREGDVYQYTIKSSLPVLTYVTRTIYSDQAEFNSITVPTYDMYMHKFELGNLPTVYISKYRSSNQKFNVTLPENGRYALVIDTRVSQSINGNSAKITPDSLDISYTVEKVKDGNPKEYVRPIIGVVDQFPIYENGMADTRIMNTHYLTPSLVD